MHDVVEGAEDRMRVRHAIACVLVALKSRSDEDMTISAKVCAKMGDEFEEKLIAELVKMGAKRLAKGKAKQEGSAPEQAAGAPEQAAAAPSRAGVQSEGSKGAPGSEVTPGSSNVEVDPAGTASHARPVGATRDPFGGVPQEEAAARAQMKQVLMRQGEAAVRQSKASGAPGSATLADAANSSTGRSAAGIGV